MAKKAQGFNIYEYSAQVAFAFREDCAMFIEHFQSHHSFKYEVFVKVWKELYFISIFEGQNIIVLLKTFIENAFYIINRFLYSDNPYVQTGAFFLLYSIYYKQPIKDLVKIRFTQSEAEQMKKIYEFHKHCDFLELVFMYSKMHLDGAIIFCALPHPLGLEPQYLKRFNIAKDDFFVYTKKISTLKEAKDLLKDDPIIAKLRKVNEKYMKVAEKCKEKYQGLCIGPSSIDDDIESIYKSILEDREHTDTNDVTGMEDELEVKEEPGTSGEGTRRNISAKEKAMSNVTSTYRGEKVVITATDLETHRNTFHKRKRIQN